MYKAAKCLFGHYKMGLRELRNYLIYHHINDETKQFPSNQTATHMLIKVEERLCYVCALKQSLYWL
jgi:hypothetical protein